MEPLVDVFPYMGLIRMPLNEAIDLLEQAREDYKLIEAIEAPKGALERTVRTSFSHGGLYHTVLDFDGDGQILFKENYTSGDLKRIVKGFRHSS